MSNKPQKSVIFVFERHGNSVKVTAVDEETGREVVVIAPAKLPQADMQLLALRKLEKVLKGQNEFKL
jgi:hypothetical protein